MRKKTLFNDGWRFVREDCGAKKAFDNGVKVTIPHTWNAKDGQDGGNDYYRGSCWYAKHFSKPELKNGDEAWLEFEGAAMTAEVYLNGVLLFRHEGGYSTFRVNLTDGLRDENLLAVKVDNGRNTTVYPQKADFTFYGGIYRDVHLLTVPAAHFALDHHGAPGIKVTPVLSADRKTAVVTVEAWVQGDARQVCFTVDGQSQIAPVTEGKALTKFTLASVRLWDGLADPHLYTAVAELDSGDRIETTFGCRTINFTAEDGFILNGKRLRLCGAARHQDRQGIGSALTRAEHDEDMALMLEMGVNTIRLAHYQHSQYFYDLCDKAGVVVWAEIPYITEHMPEGRANTLSQMTELVVQNYNHPSIICWGLSNEITAAGGVNTGMVENHKLLKDLCHSLDTTRPTAMAHAFMLEHTEPFALLPDILSYNLYYGWYLAEVEQNDQWFDDFHAAHPDTPVGLAEYGADANPAYQTGKPEKGDWSEAYQAVYHEHMLEMWQTRPYIWAMHVWNMFDFGADGRNEGGKPGQNQKGLVTFDRKLKKDAFFLYKAYLSGEPFVHLCGSRYINRTEPETEIKVYSNQSSVTLLVDGREYATLRGSKVFRFHLPISGEHRIEARSGELSDSITIRKTDQPNPAYRKEGEAVINWFDRPEEVRREGYYSILDTMADLKKNPEASVLLAETMATARKSYGEVAKNITMPESVQRMMDQMTLESVIKQAGKAIPPAMAKALNSKLNQIKKQSSRGSGS